MPPSEEERQAYNAECKRNFAEYNFRINNLETEFDKTPDHSKLVRAVQEVQRELAAKSPEGKPVVKLWDKPPANTRNKFRERLNRLFQVANEKNKETILSRIRDLEQKLQFPNPPLDAFSNELRELDRQQYAVPKSDADKDSISQRINSLGGAIKRLRHTAVRIPALDEAIQAVAQEFDKVEKLVVGVEKRQRDYKDYFPTIGLLKNIHGILKEVGKKIKEEQTGLKDKSLDRITFDHYRSALSGLYDATQRCWRSPVVQELSSWCADLASTSYQYFSDKLDEIEAHVEKATTHPHVIDINKQLKALEEELSLRDADGNYFRPVKREHQKEFYDRVRGCKAALQDIWAGVTTASMAEFASMVSKIRSVYALLQEAKCRDHVENVRKSVQALNVERKNLVAEGKLNPGQGSVLHRETQAIWDEAMNLIHIMKPEDFSYEWLSRAFAHNRENNWVIFVDSVPAIAR